MRYTKQFLPYELERSDVNMPTVRPLRLVVLGEGGVGKTAVVEQFIFGNHVIGQGGPPTIGDTYEVCVETDKGSTEKLQIFDTPGTLFTTRQENHSEQEHFLSIADGFLLVYEITSKASYDVIVSIRQRIAVKNKDTPIIVLGNKSDLNAIRDVDYSSVAQPWARNHGVRLYEVNVLDRDSLKEPFCYIAWRMANPGRQFPHIPSAPMKSLSSVPLPSDRQPVAERFDDDHPDSPHQASGFSRMYPEDAAFPKHSPALFFTDCLSSKSKKYKEGRY